MLTELTIHNCVLADNVRLTFATGMTVITGETGAGKSILIDALALVFGARANTRFIGNHDDKTIITAHLTSVGDAADELSDYHSSNDDGWLLKRVISNDGRSRAAINDIPATVTALRQIADSCLDMHSQRDNAASLDGNRLLAVLDAFADATPLLDTVNTAAEQWRVAQRTLDGYSNSNAEQLALNRYYLQELVDAGINAEELATIEARHQQVAQRHNAAGQLQAIHEALNTHEDAWRALHGIERQLTSLSTQQPYLADIASLFHQVNVALTEAQQVLARNDDSSEDEQTLAELDARLTTLHALARKHRVPLQALAETMQALEDSVSAADNAASAFTKQQQIRDEALRRWREAAQALHTVRKQAVESLIPHINAALTTLIKGASCQAALSYDDATPRNNGGDTIALLVRTNPGNPFGKLADVASGGERSRIRLAIDSTLASHLQTPIIVFDEVDTGVGGDTAHLLAEHIVALSRGRQVLCITHLPTIAARADHHFVVDKTQHDTCTTTTVRQLTDENARLTEIARMLGDGGATETSIAYARTLRQR